MGVFMVSWDELDERGQCSVEEDYREVERVCRHLDVSCHRANFVKEYWNNVFRLTRPHPPPPPSLPFLLLLHPPPSLPSPSLLLLHPGPLPHSSGGGGVREGGGSIPRPPSHTTPPSLSLIQSLYNYFSQ